MPEVVNDARRMETGESRAAFRIACRRRLPHTTQGLQSDTKLQKTQMQLYYLSLWSGSVKTRTCYATESIPAQKG